MLTSRSTGLIAQTTFLPLYRLVSLSCRYSSSYASSSLFYAKHAFDAESAAKRFLLADRTRLFAPLESEMKPVTNELSTESKNPLTKALIPFTAVDATTLSVTANYTLGEEVKYKAKDEDNKIVIKTKIVWSETLTKTFGGSFYSAEHPDMRVYSGFEWASRWMERSIANKTIKKIKTPFEAELVGKEIFIDPFLKCSAMVNSTVKERLTDLESYRVTALLQAKHADRHVNLQGVSLSFRAEHSHFMWPLYILQYPNTPPSVLCAVEDTDMEVTGSRPLSLIKTTLAATISTAVATFFFPAISVGVRLGYIAFSAFSGAMYARHNQELKYQQDLKSIEREKSFNRCLTESAEDKARIAATQRLGEGFVRNEYSESEHPRIENKNNSGYTRHDQDRYQQTSRDFDPSKLKIDLAFYRILDLDPTQPVTKEALNAAFIKQIQKAHPDRPGGNSELARKVYEARNTFKKELDKEAGKRHFSTSTHLAFFPRETRLAPLHTEEPIQKPGRKLL